MLSFFIKNRQIFLFFLYTNRKDYDIIIIYYIIME